MPWLCSLIRERQEMNAFDMPRLLRAIQVGLQFNITPAMRFIFINLEADTIWLKAYFDREPTDAEREMLLEAAVEAGGHAEEVLNVDVKCVCDTRPFQSIPQVGSLVFARHEPES